MKPFLIPAWYNFILRSLNCALLFAVSAVKSGNIFIFISLDFSTFSLFAISQIVFLTVCCCSRTIMGLEPDFFCLPHSVRTFHFGQTGNLPVFDHLFQESGHKLSRVPLFDIFILAKDFNIKSSAVAFQFLRFFFQLFVFIFRSMLQIFSIFSTRSSVPDNAYSTFIHFPLHSFNSLFSESNWGCSLSIASLISSLIIEQIKAASSIRSMLSSAGAGSIGSTIGFTCLFFFPQFLGDIKIQTVPF